MNDLEALQLEIENHYSKKRISLLVRDEVSNTPALVSAISQCSEALDVYRQTTYSYNSKNERVAALNMDILEEAVMKVLDVVMLLDRPITFTSLVGMTCGAIPGDKLSSIRTISEVIAYMHYNNVLTAIPASQAESGMMEVCPIYVVSQEVKDFAHGTRFLPPMICEPKELKNNRSSGYLTIKGESLILKGGNHHNGNICLDNLNRLNSIALSLDEEMLKVLKDESKVPLDTPKKKDQFDKLQADSEEVFNLILKTGNKFYLNHQPDKRGRTYAKGYHISVQGNSFRKAIINFHKKEVVEGVY